MRRCILFTTAQAVYMYFYTVSRLCITLCLITKDCFGGLPTAPIVLLILGRVVPSPTYFIRDVYLLYIILFYAIVETAGSRLYFLLWAPLVMALGIPGQRRSILIYQGYFGVGFGLRYLLTRVSYFYIFIFLYFIFYIHISETFLSSTAQVVLGLCGYILGLC